MKKTVLPLLILMNLLALWGVSARNAAYQGSHMLYAPLVQARDLPEGVSDYVGLLIRTPLTGTTTTSDLYTIRADGSDLKPLVVFPEPGASITSVVWSPDSTKVAFTTDALYTVNIDGTNLQRFDLSLNSMEVKAWTPDSEALILQAQTASFGQQLYFYDPANEVLRPGITHGNFYEIQWFPDERYFLVMMWDSVDHSQLIVVDSNDMSETVITPFFPAHFFIGFVENGNRLLTRAYDHAEGLGYYLMDRDGSNSQQVGTETEGILAVTPDQHGFLYVEEAVYRYDIPPTTATLIADLSCAPQACTVYETDYSANGSMVAFSIYRTNGARELWVAPLTPLTTVPTLPVATGLTKLQWLDDNRYLIAHTPAEAPNYQNLPVLLDLENGTQRQLIEDPNNYWRDVEWRYLP